MRGLCCDQAEGAFPQTRPEYRLRTDLHIRPADVVLVRRELVVELKTMPVL